MRLNEAECEPVSQGVPWQRAIITLSLFICLFARIHVAYTKPGRLPANFPVRFIFSRHLLSDEGLSMNRVVAVYDGLSALSELTRAKFRSEKEKWCDIML